jgi:hypothetical protein
LFFIELGVAGNIVYGQTAQTDDSSPEEDI